MSADDEASELRKRLTNTMAAVETLQRRLDDIHGSCFGCPPCAGDHRTLVLQRLEVSQHHGGVRYDRGFICPATGRAVLLSDDGSSVVSP